MSVRVVTDPDEARRGDLIRTGHNEQFRKCPRCGVIQSIANHTVDWVAITVTPSILCNIDGCDAHYFITEGEIVWA